MIRAGASLRALRPRRTRVACAWSTPSGFAAPKTKSAVAVLDAIGAEGRVLVVLSRDDDVTARSLSNLPHVVALPGDQLTAFDVLSADVIVFTDETLPGGERRMVPRLTLR